MVEESRFVMMIVNACEHNKCHIRTGAPLSHCLSALLGANRDRCR
jgi:hypothetical protein